MDPETVSHMIREIKQGRTPGKMRAAIALGKARVTSDKALKALQSMLDNDYAPARSSALYALGRSGDSEVTSAVAPLLADPAMDVRIAACRAIRRLDAGRFVNKLPLDDPNDLVRLAAIRAAGASGDKGVVSRLKKTYHAENTSRNRTAVLQALRGLNAGAQVSELAGEAIQHASARVRLAGAKLLTGLSADELQQRRSQVADLLDDNSALVRRAAVNVFDKILAESSEGLQKSLLPMLDDRDPTVVAAVAETVGRRCRSAETMLELEKLLAHADRKIRRTASLRMLRAARRHPDWERRLVRTAVETLHASESAKRCEGLWILGQLRSQAGFPDALKLAEKTSTRADMREARLVAWLIYRSGYEPGGKLLTAFFTDDDQYLRVHAARGLGVLKHKPAESKIISELQNIKIVQGMPMYTYTGQERYFAIWTLGQFGDKKALQALTTLAAKRRPMAKAKNLKLMCDIFVEHDYQPAIEPLRSLYMYSNAGKRHKRIAAEAINELAGRKEVSIPAKEEEPKYETFFLNAR